MHQISFTVRNHEDADKALDTLKKSPFYRDGVTVYAEISDNDRDSIKMSALVRRIRKAVKNVRIAGFTSVTGINKGSIVTSGAVVTFMIFESSEVTVFSYDGTKYTEEETAKLLAKDIEGIDGVCMRLFVNSLFMKHPERFFDNFILKNKDLQVTGTTATGDIYRGDDSVYLVNDDGVLNRGVVAVVFAGANLHAKTTVALGWEPSGIEHTITKMTKDNVIKEIDGRPATELYQKYLGVNVDENFLFEIIEFPLMIEKKGITIARGAIGMDEDRGLKVPPGLKEGDKVKLSLAIISDMLKQTRGNAEILARFQPQGIILTVCLNRYMYLSDDQQQEINFYRAVVPELAGCSCGGELMSIGNRIYWLNCVLTALAMREGEIDKSNACPVLPDIKSIADTHNRIPLSDKIARFTRESTAEFVEMLLRNEIDAERAANEAKSAFLSNMSHEIRTPINSILGMDEMILRATKEDSTREYANHIKNAGHTLLYLINDILDFSKIEVGKLEIHPDYYSVSSMIYDLLIMIEAKATEKNLEIKIEIDENIPDGLIGDEIRIRQVLLNILTNAVKYTKEGSVTFKADCTKKEEDNADLTFHIIDTGIGIKDENLDKLFSPFERIDEEKNRSIEGTGLGMNITKNLLKMMGSELQVESVYGEGSDFYFTINQGVHDSSGIGDFVKTARLKYEPGSDMKEYIKAPEASILVVDDTSENLTVVEQLLKRTQINIDTAESGNKCIAKASKKKYDIIFMDHRMPGMDGTVAMQIIKNNDDYPMNRTTPVIVLTANVVSGMRERFLKDGFDDYLEKPVNPQELDEMIKKYLPPEKIEIVYESSGGEDVSAETAEIIEKVKNIVQIDEISAISVCGGRETYVKILKEFSEGAAAKKLQLEEFMAAEDLKNFEVKIHALKTEARLVGAPDFSEMCYRLEKAADTGDTDYVHSRFPAVMEWFDELVRQIKEALPGPESDDDKELIDEESLKEAYSAMLEMAGVFDMESVEWVMNKLSGYRMPDEEKLRYEKLKTAVLDVDADAVIGILKS